MTERYQVGRYAIHEPRPNRFRVYQAQMDGSIQRTGIDFVSMESALKWVTQKQLEDIAMILRDLRICSEQLKAR